ncbi:hypothetical protein EVAR_9242_1 [Eumeta japonica]|uniref:Uncharacterized protein n=1 Tax=Eumeta variegata TaxID=151549 RepID=A0A4C1TLS0_EUMVA|nr:hypothetical protein EVAR_9242_1 [Eumeta japonica]
MVRHVHNLKNCVTNSRHFSNEPKTRYSVSMHCGVRPRLWNVSRVGSFNPREHVLNEITNSVCEGDNFTEPLRCLTLINARLVKRLRLRARAPPTAPPVLADASAALEAL